MAACANVSIEEYCRDIIMILVACDLKELASYDIPDRVPGTVDTVCAYVDLAGDFPPTLVWDCAVPGKYDIVLDVNGNGIYDEGVDALDDMDVNSAGFFVVPEYPLGTILGVAMCFAALAAFRSKGLRIHR